MTFRVQLFVFPKVSICLHFFQLLIFSWRAGYIFSHPATSLKMPLSIPSTAFPVLFPRRRPRGGLLRESSPPCSDLECGSLSYILLEISLASLMWEPLVSRSLDLVFVCLFILSIFVNTRLSHFLREDKFLRTLMSESLFIFYPHTHSGVAVLLIKMATVILPTPLIPTTL